MTAKLAAPRSAHSVPEVEDVQSRPDTRALPINRVGIKDIRHPVRVKDRSAGEQHTIATFNITARLRSHMWIEELIQVAESEASCELYGILKRPDEKHVTERGYDNPKFVEDMVRDVATRLNLDPRVGAYVVESENFESIHNHSAYALIEHDKDA